VACYSRAAASDAVVCYHSYNFSALAELHELRSSCAFLIAVVEDDAGETLQHIEEFELQVGISFEPSFEIGAQRSVSLYRAQRIIEELGRDRRRQDNFWRVVRHYGLEIVGIPRFDPMARKAFSIKGSVHVGDQDWG